MKIQRHKLLKFSIFLIFIFLIILRINLSVGYTDDSNPPSSKMFHTVADGPNSVISENFDGNEGKDFAMANRNSDNILILFGKPDGSIIRGMFYEVGDSPECIISGDFYKDGNGIPDLAVVNSGSNNISVLFNNGDGTFGSIINQLVGDSPECIISGDFYEDGNGIPDLAVANSSSNNISILFNNGDGTFDETVKVATGDSPKSITSADFNHDGHADLAVANYDSDNIFIIPGKGDHTFSRAVSYEAGKKPMSIISGDFHKDGNGMPDLAVANSDSDNITVLINNGDGTFGSILSYAVGEKPVSIVSGDFNKDGNDMVDLAVVNSDSDSVSVLINNGDGTFGSAVNYQVGDSPESIFSAYINDDGYLDLVVVNSSSNDMWILFNKGDGTFLDDTNYAYKIGGTPESIITDDFDNDGFRDDLAAVNSGSNTLTIFIGNGEASIFGKIFFYLDLLGENPKSIISDYFDEGVNVDLAVANSDSDSVTILVGDGNGVFTQNDIIDDVGGSPASIVSAGFNKDEYTDLAVVNSEDDQLKIIFGKDGGLFDINLYECATGKDPISIISYNFNNISDNGPNSIPDLAVANRGSNNIYVWLGNGDDTIFDAAKNYNLGVSPEAIISADFNKDGNLDLSSANVGSPDRHVIVLLGNGYGTFSEKSTCEVVDEVEVEVEEKNRKIEPTSIASGDFDNDSNLDLAVASSIINTAYNYDYVTLFFGNGNGTFMRGINIEVGDLPNSIISTSFDSGGKADLAVVNSDGITILKNEFLSKLKPVNKAPDQPLPEPEEDLGGGICFISILSFCLR